MLVRTLLVLFSALSVLGTAEAARLWEKNKNVVTVPVPESPTIKILLVHDAEAAMVEVKGKYDIFDPYQNKRLSTRQVGKSSLMQALKGGLKWGEEFPGVYQLLFVPTNPNITTVIDGNEYRGRIYVYDIGGAISIVNEVSLEDFIKSKMALEYKNALAPEAMAALAIIERTNALFQSSNTTNPFWNIRGKDIDYQGYAITGRNNGVDEAVDATRFMVVSRGDANGPTINPFLMPIKRSANENGPGVPLDQVIALAAKGENAKQILTHLMPNTSLHIVSSQPQVTNAIPGAVKN